MGDLGYYRLVSLRPSNLFVFVIFIIINSLKLYLQMLIKRVYLFSCTVFSRPRAIVLDEYGSIYFLAISKR